MTEAAPDQYDPKGKPLDREKLRRRRAAAAACLVALGVWIARRHASPAFAVAVAAGRQSDTAVAPWGASSYVFRRACVAMNARDDDQGVENSQRTLVWFNRSDDYPKRCVSCNNPVVTQEWNGIADYVEHLSPEWRREGGLLKDADRPCGMMWDNVLVAKDLDDARACRRRHAQEVRDRGQVVSLDSVVHRPRAAILQWFHGNPGHQLLDSLLSQLDVFRNYDGPFESHQSCDEREWYCAILKMLGVTVSPVPPTSLVCYDEVSSWHCCALHYPFAICN